jgi:hypothetical protein
MNTVVRAGRAGFFAVVKAWVQEPVLASAGRGSECVSLLYFHVEGSPGVHQPFQQAL